MSESYYRDQHQPQNNVVNILPPDPEPATGAPEEGSAQPAEILQHPDFMRWRTQHLSLDQDKDYPRFNTEYRRRRWHWETGEVEGDAAFAVTALIGALRASRSQRPGTLSIMKDTPESTHPAA